MPDTHTYGDFQTTADGRFAAFGSALSRLPDMTRWPLYEVFRYAADVGTLTCACNPTMPMPGMVNLHNITWAKDGHLFFNSNDRGARPGQQTGGLRVGRLSFPSSVPRG